MESARASGNEAARDPVHHAARTRSTRLVRCRCLARRSGRSSGNRGSQRTAIVWPEAPPMKSPTSLANDSAASRRMSRSITSNARRAVAGSTCASLGSLVTSSRVGAHRRLLGGLLRRAALDEEPPPHAGRDRARLHAVPALQLDLGTIPPIGKACWRCRASCATALGRHDGDAISKTRRPTVVHPTFILSISFFHARPSTCRSFTNFRAARQRACAIPHRWRRAAVALSWSFVACPYLHGPGLSKTNES